MISVRILLTLSIVVTLHTGNGQCATLTNNRLNSERGDSLYILVPKLLPKYSVWRSMYGNKPYKGWVIDRSKYPIFGSYMPTHARGEYYFSSNHHISIERTMMPPTYSLEEIESLFGWDKAENNLEFERRVEVDLKKKTIFLLILQKKKGLDIPS